MKKFFVPAAMMIAAGLLFQTGRFTFVPAILMEAAVFSGFLLVPLSLVTVAVATAKFGWRSVWVWLATAIGCIFISSPMLWLIWH